MTSGSGFKLPMRVRIQKKQINTEPSPCGPKSGPQHLLPVLLCFKLTFSSETMQRDSRSRHLDSLRQRSSSLLISTHSSVIRPLSNLHKYEFNVKKGLLFSGHTMSLNLWVEKIYFRYWKQCCGSVSGIWCFLDLWIRIENQFSPDPGSWIPNFYLKQLMAKKK